MLAKTLRVGRLRCHLLEGGLQRLDGGAMFGVVPKPLWEKKITPDERNRIPLAMRCLLIEHDDGLVLIDTGLGNKESEKFLQIYGVENTGKSGPTQLEDALADAGYKPADVKTVINTHLHFDHAGGNTFIESISLDNPPTRAALSAAKGQPALLSFPNATYVVQKGELDYALHTNERTAASYLPHNFEPVATAGRWRLVDGEAEVLPGIRVWPTPGHVPFHQSVLVSNGGETACFLADVMPTTAHVPLPWIMGYDVEPLRTLESKRKLVARAFQESWTLVFEHDPEQGLGRVIQDGKSFIYQRLDTP